MKRGILQHKFALWVIAALTLASCSQDAPMGDNGTSLPEGVYPLEIASVTLDVEGSAQPWGADALQTRVSENETGTGSTWDWDGTEQIGVQLYDGGDEAIYTLTKDYTLSADRPLYWKDTQQATVKAWYPATGGEIDLTQQKGNKCLAYVLTGTGNGDYQTPVSLSFTHALAKIRVLLAGEQAEQVTSVQVKSYTRCTHNKGTVSGSSEGWIEMLPATYEGTTYWEANVVPELEITEIQLNGSTPCTLTKNVKPEKGNCHEITINVEGKDVTIESNYTITDEHKPIIITGDHTVTFNNARITSDDRPLIKINDGCKPTLVFEGTNVLKCNWDNQNNGSITSGEDDEYNIKLEDGARLAVISECAAIGSPYRRIKLNISGNGEMWVQSNGWNFPAIIVKNGSLNISEGVVLTAVSTNTMPGNSGDWKYVPAIGLTLSSSGVTGGSIILRDCTLKLYAYAMGGKTPEHWVTLENGTVSPDVDSKLKNAAWDEEVSLDNNVKATKLEDRPELPGWATK